MPAGLWEAEEEEPKPPRDALFTFHSESDAFAHGAAPKGEPSTKEEAKHAKSKTSSQTPPQAAAGEATETETETPASAQGRDQGPPGGTGHVRRRWRPRGAAGKPPFLPGDGRFKPPPLARPKRPAKKVCIVYRCTSRPSLSFFDLLCSFWFVFYDVCPPFCFLFGFKYGGGVLVRANLLPCGCEIVVYIFVLHIVHKEKMEAYALKDNFTHKL